jgi:hypothetical protein
MNEAENAPVLAFSVTVGFGLIAFPFGSVTVIVTGDASPELIVPEIATDCPITPLAGDVDSVQVGVW